MTTAQWIGPGDQLRDKSQLRGARPGENLRRGDISIRDDTVRDVLPSGDEEALDQEWLVRIPDTSRAEGDGMAAMIFSGV